MSNSLKLYTQNNCMYCEIMKAKLDAWGIKYDVINLTEHPEHKQFLIDQDLRMVPQLFYNGEKVNPDDTNDFEKSDLLKTLSTRWPGEDSGVEDMS